MGMNHPTHHDSSDASNASSNAQSSSSLHPSDAPLTKTKSAGNLLSHAQAATMTLDTQRQRMSFDAGSLDRMARSPIVSEHDHGLGTSGLRRIRQQPPLRVSPNVTGGTSTNNRSSSMNISLPPSRRPSSTIPSAPSSPYLNFSEDLSRFPSESLHSFSFAHQSEEFIHNRQNVLKRSIDFMRDRLGWSATSPSILQAQAKLTGDQEVQSMMELLHKANLIGQESSNGHGLGVLGPITGPAVASGENIFEKSFFRSESPTSLEEDGQSPETSRTASGSNQAAALAQESAIVDDETSPTSARQTSIEPLEARRSSARPQRVSLKRTYTDIGPLTLETQLDEALAQPYLVGENHKASQIQPSALPTSPQAMSAFPSGNPAPHGHGSRWAPAAQAIFTTDTHTPWTITSANDLACLVFGVTRAEVRKMGILEVVRPERRKWLEEKLNNPDGGSAKPRDAPVQPPAATTMAMGNGVTARLLSKPPSRAKRRSQTDDGVGSSYTRKPAKSSHNHAANKSRGVLLCGDVVPIQKRNGALGAASLWVKEKRGGLIWVMEEIAEDVVLLKVDEVGCVVKGSGATEAIWGDNRIRRGMDVQRLIPGIPKLAGTNTGALDYEKIDELRNFTARTSNDINIPISVEPVGEETFRVSSFPHIAGIIVLSADSLEVTSSNAVFSSALFGQVKPEGSHINKLIPSLDRILRVMTDEDNIDLVDGIVIPEHSFRRARALLAMREGKADAAALFLKPSGLPAKHRDGCEIMVDVQMRVVKSEKSPASFETNAIEEKNETDENSSQGKAKSSDIVYALWITYSRHLHATNHGVGPVTQTMSRPGTPPHQPSPGQTVTTVEPVDLDSDDSATKTTQIPVSLLSKQLKEAQSDTVPNMPDINKVGSPEPKDADKTPRKKTINDFSIIEEMGQGAYGQVKLCRYKNSSKKVVIKYVTKRRILVDTWTRDRRLGTVPLEIHVLDYLRRDGFKHPNIVEMADFFEDDINYYIEMVPHGLPGMDLFDYIELRVNMEEIECRNIFVQVAEALHHLHTKAKVVHRDIKDENVILDGEGNIKLIDFGSAAYIKNGPFDVFVGTIDYAAPEVLAGKSYRGKEQDVWALGILLYTIVYKENPFYSIDEIMDHDLRVPYIMSDESIDLIRQMLNRDVEKRITIGQVLEHPWCHMKIEK